MLPAPYSAGLWWRVIPFVMLSWGQLAVRKAVSVGSLTKHDVEGSENVTWKCILAFLIMPEKCALLTILELNWNQRLGQDKIEHLSIQLQKRSFHVIERTRTSSKCQKMKNARAKRAKILFFIVKYANFMGFLLLSSSWLLKLSIVCKSSSN